MCKCKQAIEWQVYAEIDEHAMMDGYDGDVEPGTDTSDWVAYQLVSYAICTRCDARTHRDGLGGTWVTPATSDIRGYLSDTVKHYGMVPKGADFELSIAW